MKKTLRIVAAGLMSWHAMAADDPEARTRWFDEARFGLFIHWGVYAVPAGEWEGKPAGGGGEWILKTAGIPVAAYKALAGGFTADQFDPSAWAKLARTAGMKYVVITSKHHDGFALYDSAVTSWDAVNASAAKRDLLEPLARAVRAEGLKFGLYYSQSQDWVHPGGGVMGEHWDPAQEGDYDTYLTSVALPQVKEIVERYKPAILWWDTPRNMTPERVKPFAEFMAQHPEIINNDRLGEGFAGDTKTPEQHIPPRGYPGRRFEVCMTMNDTWGFKRNDQNWKSVRQLLRHLSDISSKGGNFLLNVGPTADGRIPQESVDRLTAIGRWMDVNGEAIHGTQAGPFPRRLPWGRVTQKRGDSGSTTLYLHIWEWPADGQLLLPTVKESPSAGRLVAGGNPVSWRASDEGLVIQLPKSSTDPDVSVVRLDFPGPVSVTQEPFIEPDAAGRIEFTALDADAHGTYSGNIQLRGAGREAYLTDWKNPGWKLEYQLKTAKARKWNVFAEVASPDPTRLNLKVKNVATPVEIAATGPGLTWKSVPLGAIELPEGEAVFELVGIKENWKGPCIRRVWLDPAN